MAHEEPDPERMDAEDRTRERFLVGCLVLVAILGCGSVILWTPLPNLWVYMSR